MKVVIMGCGRLGARLATSLDAGGNEVTVLDLRTDAFKRLPAAFGGEKVVGNGMDGRTLERAGIAPVKTVHDLRLAPPKGTAGKSARKISHILVLSIAFAAILLAWLMISLR